ncbi:MAG: hypothetical protein ACYS47_04215 [Planctomycetota bacterium]|jgi:hypothetical protein
MGRRKPSKPGPFRRRGRRFKNWLDRDRGKKRWFSTGEATPFFSYNYAYLYSGDSLGRWTWAFEYSWT